MSERGIGDLGCLSQRLTKRKLIGSEADYLEIGSLGARVLFLNNIEVG